ncbi:MAG: hypothetical protein HRT76_09875 [Halieaceae bacterium]|nr:hypothetical protein [Halieaceae bacterium]
MKKSAAIVASLMLAAGAQAQECSAPEAPTLPAGESSSMEQMLEGQKAVKTYQAANLEYMACLETVFTDAEKAAKEGPDDGKTAAQKTYKEAMDAYNEAVAKEEAVAGDFNAQIRAYKAANPG